MMDASPAERVFRMVENELESMLALAMPALTTLGLAYTDRSTHACHCKESYLRWEAVLERRWQQDLFTKQIQITLSYGEPINSAEAPQVSIFRRAEIFRQSQVSSLDSKHEESCPLEVIRAQGMTAVVMSHLATAAALLDVTL